MISESNKVANSVQHRKGFFSKYNVGYFIFFNFYIVAISVLAINKLAPSYMNADTLLFSIMSTQNVTPFIWGQDRLANFIPFILSAVTSVHLNMFLHLFIFSSSFFILIYVLSKIITKINYYTNEYLSRLLALSIISAVSIFSISPFALHVFIVEGQPYALSYLLLLLSFTAFTKASSNNSPYILISVIILFISLGLNPSILIPAAALSFGYSVIYKNVRVTVFFVMSILFFLIWGKLSTLFGTPTGVTAYNIFDFRHAMTNLLTTSQSILAQAELTFIIIILCIICLINFFYDVDQNKLNNKLINLGWVFALLWVFIFAQNKWVKMNNSHFRYFFPIFIMFIFYLSCKLHLYIIKLNKKLIIAAIVILISSTFAYFYSPVVAFSNYKVLDKTKTRIHLMTENNVNMVAGNYWEVWPLFFEMTSEGHDIYSFAYRAEENKERTLRAFATAIKNNGVIKILCLEASSNECITDVEKITGIKMHLINENRLANHTFLSLKPK